MRETGAIPISNFLRRENRGAACAFLCAPSPVCSGTLQTIAKPRKWVTKPINQTLEL